jgi:hypothetical protein
MTARVSEALLLAAWCFGAFAGLRSLAFQVKAARRTKPGKHWWFRMNTLDPIIDPEAWTPEARAYWRQHLLWAVPVPKILTASFPEILAGLA